MRVYIGISGKCGLALENECKCGKFYVNWENVGKCGKIAVGKCGKIVVGKCAKIYMLALEKKLYLKNPVFLGRYW